MAKKVDQICIPVLWGSFPKAVDILHANDKDHGSDLLKGLLTMFKQGRYTDVSLKIGPERTQRAHRVVLESFSPYFEALLGDNWEEGKKDKIEILGLDENAVSDLIAFAYTGNIGICEEQLPTTDCRPTVGQQTADS